MATLPRSPVSGRGHVNNSERNHEQYPRKRRWDERALDSDLHGGQDPKRYHCSSPNSSLDSMLGRFVDEHIDARLSDFLKGRKALTDTVDGHSTQLQKLDSTMASNITSNSKKLDAMGQETAMLRTQIKNTNERLDTQKTLTDNLESEISRLKVKCEMQTKTMNDLRITISSLEEKFDLRLRNMKEKFESESATKETNFQARLKELEENKTNLIHLKESYETKMAELQEKHSGNMAVDGAAQQSPQVPSNIADDIVKIRTECDSLKSEQKATNEELKAHKATVTTDLRTMDDSITTLGIDLPLLANRVSNVEGSQIALNASTNDYITKVQLGSEKRRINQMMTQWFATEKKHRDDRMDHAEKMCRDREATLRSEIIRGEVKLAVRSFCLFAQAHSH
jgi:chromosome segregation ATPase